MAVPLSAEQGVGTGGVGAAANSGSNAKTAGKATINRIELADLTANNAGQLRKLNAVLFPVRFGEKWYKDVLQEDVREICKFALFNDIPVANVCCRFERQADGSDGKDTKAVKVYIMTLGCLAPYRRLGIASKLLKHVLDVAGPGKEITLTPPKSEEAKSDAASNAKKTRSKTAKEEQQAKEEYFTVSSVYLHVQTGNDEAKAFYERHGFQVREKIDEYYKVGISPRSAWMLERTQT